ncbi:DUF5329 family protein [Kiritimatiellaeota bacterium B1221]|nr:DUF5329 family protein [Kiritimatiellaeota bacterium B1221]
MKKILPLLAICCCLPLFAHAENTADVVAALIAQTKNSGATFIRNGKTHSAEEAAAHLQKKYDHFLKKGKIKSPEDFIKLAGTKSLISKKDYLLKLPDGTEVKSADWLTAQLAGLREK